MFSRLGSHMNCSHQKLDFTPFFGAPFWLPDRSDMKNNGRFGFGIPKNIEIDICIVPIENFEFYSPLPFKALFWLPDGSHMKNNGRFRFGIPKNIEIDTWIISIENFEFYSPFGALLALGPEGCAASGKNWNLAEKGIFLISPIRANVIFTTFENSPKIEFFEFCYEIGFKLKFKPSSFNIKKKINSVSFY